MLTILPVRGIPDVKKGDDLGRLIATGLEKQKQEIRQGDVVVVSQKIVSKAEGQVIPLSKVKPSKFALGMAKEAGKDPRHVEIILRETKKIIRMKSGHLITETRHGFICANAGVDMSNVGRTKDTVTLLPSDPDKSAVGIRRTIGKLTGKNVAVIVTDTFGRAWRMGQVNFAIGVSGLNPIRDYRGTRDMYRHVLHVTEIAVADELACAGELLMNKADRVPAVVVRGYKYQPSLRTARALIRPEELDLFR